MSASDWIESHPVFSMVCAATAGFVASASVLGVVAQFGGFKIVPEDSYVQRTAIDEQYLRRDEVRDRFVARTEYEECRNTAEQSEERAQRFNSALSECKAALAETQTQHGPSPGRENSNTLRSLKDTAAEVGGAARSPSQTVGGLSVTLEGCHATGDAAECMFMITNRREERKIYLYTKTSRLIDQKGREVTAHSASLGTTRFTVWWSINDLVQDIPVRAVLYFEDVPGDTEILRLLEVSFGHRSSRFAAQFKNIPLDPD